MVQHTRALAAALACALIAAEARAQSESTEAQVITVTAQKRKEDVRKVPLAVSVLSGEALQDNHITNFVDLSASVPNLSFSPASGPGPGLSTLQMRGISSQAGSATVAVYLDDVSMTTRNLYSQGTAEPRFFDIDHVEVLRGPQGTLYGASSLGGTLKFIGRQPNLRALEGGAYAELSGTSHGGVNHTVQGVLNIPLARDSVALRIGVQSGKESGFIDRVDVNTLKVIEKGINDARWDVLKLALKAQLGPTWALTPALFYQRTRTGDIDAAYEAVGDYQSANVGVPLAPFQTSKIVREPGKDTLTVPSLTLTGDVGFGDLTGILSGYDRRFTRRQDGTSINSVYIGSVVTDPALGALVGFLPSAVDLDNKIKQTSVELRLASKDYAGGGRPLTWIAGLYSARTRTEVFDNEPVFGINAAFTAAGRDINDPNQLADSFPGAFTGDSSYYSARHYNDRQSALFGELTWHFSPSLRAIAGLRVLRASQHFTREGDFYYAGGPSSFVLDSSASANTPRLALSWDVDRETTAYLNIAKGFRLGSANRPVPLTALVRSDLQLLGLPQTIPDAYKPDSLWSYELGSKSRWMGGRLALNVALFYIDWKDIQQDVNLPNAGYDFETNVGKASSRGFEFEGRARVAERWTLTASGSVTQATFSSDMPALGSDASGNLNVRKGDRIQGVPRFNAALGFEYGFEAFGSKSGFVRGSAQWVGSSKGSFARDSTDYQRPGYFTAGGAVGLNFGKVEVSAFVKNLTNNDKVIQRPDVQGVSTVYHLRPRTVGVTANFDF
jgi:outer membrane receptor protein involved in Fe transport